MSTGNDWDVRTDGEAALEALRAAISRNLARRGAEQAETAAPTPTASVASAGSERADAAPAADADPVPPRRAPELAEAIRIATREIEAETAGVADHPPVPAFGRGPEILLAHLLPVPEPAPTDAAVMPTAPPEEPETAAALDTAALDAAVSAEAPELVPLVLPDPVLPDRAVPAAPARAQHTSASADEETASPRPESALFGAQQRDEQALFELLKREFAPEDEAEGAADAASARGVAPGESRARRRWLRRPRQAD